jgi:DNA repair exonuclease SbcCD ATPase subunit
LDSDSLKHNEQRVAQMRAMYKEQQEEVDKAEAERVAQQQERDQQAREREIEFLEVQKGLVREGETRDMLIERIRKMREFKPEEPRAMGRTPAQEEELKREQEAGRAAVARNEAEEEKMRKLRAKIEEEDRKRLGTMEPVYRPNHGQDVQAPAVGATLGKVNKR